MPSSDRFQWILIVCHDSTISFFRFRLAFNRLVDFTAPRWVPCKRRKLACCNFNALILETGTNGHNLTLEFSHTINQNLTRRHAEQAQVKLVRRYIFVTP